MFLELFGINFFEKHDRNFVCKMFVFVMRPHSFKSDKKFLSFTLPSE